MFIKPYIKLSALVALSFITSCVTVGQIDVKDNTVNARADAKINTNVDATANIDTNVKTGNINTDVNQGTYYGIPSTVITPNPTIPNPRTDIFVPNPNIVKSVSFVIASPVSLSLNEEEQATIVGTTNWSDGTKDSSIVWTSSNSSVLSVDSSGNVRAIKSGNAIITATSRYDASKSAVISILVNKKGTSEEDKEQPTVLISSISVIPTFATIKVGEFFSVNASIEKSDGSKNSNVSWQSSDTSIATVTSNGSILAKKAGNVTIKAISNEDSSKYASLNLIIESTSINNPTTPEIPTCEAKITGDLNVLSGNLVQLTATNVCSDGTNGTDTFSWSSSDTTIATVDSSGKVTGIKAGNVNLTATSNLNSAVKTSVQFKVNSTCSIALSGADTTTTTLVGLNSSKQLTGTVTCNDGTSNANNISWSSSDSSVATVNTSGLIEGKKKGNATITATYKTDNSVNTTLNITVNDPNGNETKSRITENKLHLPSGIDIRNGKIYVSHHDTVGLDEGEVVVYDTSGNQTGRIGGTAFDALPTSITGVVSDGNRVWITNKTRANQSANNIYSFDTAGGTRKNAGIGLPSGTDIRDMAIDPTSKALYVANGLGYVSKVNYDASGTVDAAAQQLYFINNVNPGGIALDDLGNLFVVNVGTNPATIIKYNKDGTEALRFNYKGKNSTGPDTVRSIGDVAYDPKSGGIIYVLASLDNGKTVILRYDANGNFVNYFGEDAGIINPTAMTLGVDGTIYVSDWGTVSAGDNANKGIVHQFGPGK